MTAVKIASQTKHIDIVTCVAVLPIHDMRIYAGEVIAADIFTEGRLVLGVGRGGYASCRWSDWVLPQPRPARGSRESLDVLQALLTRDEVSWDGTYYKFAPLTVMPRPARSGGPRMMMAVINPEGIYHSTKEALQTF
ncbi:LLM class flavin-dependent oxidoreductase [Roseicyclus sp.]|uniref:LLM class flavin-dependent oxidoreductase n=1 Tax=Roseicyclus sp. TaxID=1914329 RepID=UPI001BCEF75C|nr:LLM class flavin-dependent oxidoreductase [Roseicyclus sp.]